MTPPSASPRPVSLGAVRSASWTCPPLPAPGPARTAALDRLRALIATDVERAIRAAVDAGWHPLDIGEIADGCRRQWAWFVDDAIEDGVFDWRHSPASVRLASECPRCGAEVSAGRCWGCGAPQ